MVDINNYSVVKSCTYKGEEYLVRDNGAVLRKARPNQKTRKYDNEWTFGNADVKTGYLMISTVRVHRVVALAFHGEPPTKEHIVDHIDTNRQNNRPSNLRWITRLENVVLNEVTRKRIEYRTGVNIYEFLENPEKYRDAFKDPDFSWMRSVTEEEAKNCLANVKKWCANNSSTQSGQGGKIGEWIYQSSGGDNESIEENILANKLLLKSFFENTEIIDSLTTNAKQKNWKIPSKFHCCPNKIDGDPIHCYLKNLSEGAVFAENSYYASIVVKFACVYNNEIYVLTRFVDGVKNYALAKVTYENGVYMHTSIRTFFTDIGAEKEFTLAQGLEWTGEDSIDDYC